MDFPSQVNHHVGMGHECRKDEDEEEDFRFSNVTDCIVGTLSSRSKHTGWVLEGHYYIPTKNTPTANFEVVLSVVVPSK